VGAEVVFGARGDARKLKAVFEHSALPMVMVDGERRYLDVNRPAQLWFRRSQAEMRAHTLGDFSPADQSALVAREWARLRETGCVAGHLTAQLDSTRAEIVYFALADVLPGRHVIVFAPAGWSEDELRAREAERPDPSASLTPREIEVLALAADGLSGPELAQELTLSPTTVNTHFKNIYAKLNVRNRAGAVAKALRIKVIG
jgi:DNA-binding NarL/FixJ family response regulator